MAFQTKEYAEKKAKVIRIEEKMPRGGESCDGAVFRKSEDTGPRASFYGPLSISHPEAVHILAIIIS
jgi:hypothetical protein